MTALQVEAPTAAQLAYLRDLAEKNGYPMPVVYSRQDASLTIDELRGGTYRPTNLDLGRNG